MSKPSPAKPRRRRWPWIVLGVLTIGLSWAALATSRLGYESPSYRVVHTDGPIEIRDYRSMTTVTAPMSSGNSRSGMNRGFGSLFRYITGGNETEQTIAMTTPVLISSTDETQAGATMSFVLPADVAAAGAPEPRTEELELHQVEAGTMAAIRFHGFRDDSSITEAEQALRGWIGDNHWSPTGDAMVAYYDPPWTPGFLRRNELLIPVRQLDATAATDSMATRPE